MTRLYKLDLEPNEIYNVSLNIKQGNKTVDNLRFFQTKIPKLFNIKPSTFYTFSQITEESDAVTPVVINSGISAGGASNPVGVKKVTWTADARPASREDGVTSYEPEGFEYTFTIYFDSTPNFTSYYISGFKGYLDFLNYRTDYKISEKIDPKTKVKESVLVLNLSLADIDPTAQTKYSVRSSGSPLYANIVDAITKGSTTVYLPNNTNLSKIVAGKSNVIAYGAVTTAGTTVVWKDTAVLRVGKFTDDKNRPLAYMTMGKPALADKAANTSIAIYGIYNGFTFTGGSYGFLKEKGENDTSKDTVKAANIIWQTFPTYEAKNAKTEYTFKKSSSITSSVINPNVIEKLIWEDEVRDYIYFIISDIDHPTGNEKKYFFGTYGPAKAFPTLATENTSLVGTSVFSITSPPAAHSYITDTKYKLYRASSGKVKFYTGTKTQVNNQAVPALLRKVTVQFAIARYTKKDEVWTGKWLPANNLSEAEILSSAEVLE